MVQKNRFVLVFSSFVYCAKLFRETNELKTVCYWTKDVKKCCQPKLPKLTFVYCFRHSTSKKRFPRVWSRNKAIFPTSITMANNDHIFTFTLCNIPVYWSIKKLPYQPLSSHLRRSAVWTILQKKRKAKFVALEVIIRRDNPRGEKVHGGVVISENSGADTKTPPRIITPPQRKQLFSLPKFKESGAQAHQGAAERERETFGGIDFTNPPFSHGLFSSPAHVHIYCI